MHVSSEVSTAVFSGAFQQHSWKACTHPTPPLNATGGCSEALKCHFQFSQKTVSDFLRQWFPNWWVATDQVIQKWAILPF